MREIRTIVAVVCAGIRYTLLTFSFGVMLYGLVMYRAVSQSILLLMLCAVLYVAVNVIDNYLGYIPASLSMVPHVRALRQIALVVFIIVWLLPSIRVHDLYPLAETYFMETAGFTNDTLAFLRALPGYYVDWMYAEANNHSQSMLVASSTLHSIGRSLTFLLGVALGVLRVCEQAKEAYRVEQNN